MRKLLPKRQLRSDDLAFGTVLVSRDGGVLVVALNEPSALPARS